MKRFRELIEEKNLQEDTVDDPAKGQTGVVFRGGQRMYAGTNSKGVTRYFMNSSMAEDWAEE